jgi:hypothetical protein
MKFFLIILICVLTTFQSKAQSVLPLFFYNGIDTFILGDKKTKYINANNTKIFKHFQTDTLKGKVISRYGYFKDSLFAYKIDTITFRSLVLNFSDSILAEINFFKFYVVKGNENALEYVESRMKYLKKYISNQLQKKRKV